MFKLKKYFIVLTLAASAVFFSGCSVGTSSLFVHPAEKGYDYEVTYDLLGGHINQMKTRTVYYAEDSYICQPSGSAGMLVAPKNGDKTLLGWYTKCESKEGQNGTVYTFDEADRWDFETETLTSETAPDHKLTLYARWGYNPDIRFVDALAPENTLLKWNIAIGKPIKKPTSSEPKKEGFTFQNYYADEACTQLYQFDQIITEDMISYDSESGKAYIDIYCKFTEGQNIQIKTVDQLKTMGENPEAKYILAKDLDLSNVDFKPVEGFKGEFDGNGHTISNLTIKAENRVAGIAAKRAPEKCYGLFSELDGVNIHNLTLKDTTVMIPKTTNVKVAVGAIAGRAKNSILKNITLDGISIISDGELKVDIAASYLTIADSLTKLENCSIGNKSTDVKTTGAYELFE